MIALIEGKPVNWQNKIVNTKRFVPNYCASGGIIAFDGDYITHTFTTSGP